MGWGQLSFFSAETRPAHPADLEGLLCGPGQVVRRAASARLSVVVREEWRVVTLAEAIGELGMVAETAPSPEGGTAVRTPFDPAFTEVAAAWSAGGAKSAPPTLALDGPRLRWWAVAAGNGGEQGYALRLGTRDEQVWPAVGAALARAGLPAAFVGPRADGPAYRVTGGRRLARLAELVGDRPTAAPESCWPGAATRG